ncbi:MAG: DUF721 domain-containing protein [Pseudomonadota bacterium]
MARVNPKFRPAGNRPRKPKGFVQAAATARSAVDAIAAKQGFAEADVLLNWAEIAGEALAETCQPVKVSYGAQRGLGAVLIVRASSARAPEVTHRAPQIIERINQYYGYRAISRVRVTQSTGLVAPTDASRAGGFAEGATPFQGKPATARMPSDDETAEAAAMAADISAPGLRAALTRMGAHVLAQGRNADPTDEDRKEDRR